METIKKLSLTAMALFVSMVMVQAQTPKKESKGLKPNKQVVVVQKDHGKVILDKKKGSGLLDVVLKSDKSNPGGDLPIPPPPTERK